MPIPVLRLTTLNDLPPQPTRDFVLYWMVAQRRLTANFALDHAIETARTMNKPLVIFEPLRTKYDWASPRIHRFIMDGMLDQMMALKDTPITYYPYLETPQNHGSGLLHALAKHAVCIITDEYPCFFLPRMIKAAAKKVDVRMQAVDGNGILPLRAAEKTYTTAYSFRRGLHKMLPNHLGQRPQNNPLDGLELPKLQETTLQHITKTWPVASPDMLCPTSNFIQTLELEHDVSIAPLKGGGVAGTERMTYFIENLVHGYHTSRNDPAQDGASNLSSYLHFGHVGAHQIFDAIMQHTGWTQEDLSPTPTGKRTGWWNLPEGPESFLDELITWREIGFNMTHREPDTYYLYESLPQWARTTLEVHANDPREFVYTMEEFEQARTHDELWNAAQNELVQTGQMHNYLRMLWGKKIIEWTNDPHEALEVMLQLNNKYALDGRDPNSYSGIFWCLGRYDRGWQEREIFGKIRFMSSASTRRKYKVKTYIKLFQSQDNARTENAK